MSGANRRTGNWYGCRRCGSPIQANDQSTLPIRMLAASWPPVLPVPSPDLSSPLERRIRGAGLPSFDDRVNPIANMSPHGAVGDLDFSAVSRFDQVAMETDRQWRTARGNVEQPVEDQDLILLDHV